jgi:hypothetical protein
MWLDIEQNTDIWLDCRAGKVTGSSIGKIMANYGKAFGDPAKDLAANIAVEQLTGKRLLSCGYSNGHMDRGHEEEPIARAAYEEMFFVDVGHGGFFDNGDTGSSPDGRVMEDGLIEIKSAIASVHYNRIRKGGYDSTYKWQFIFNLRESGREWIDFVSYCSDFPEGTRLYVYRITRGSVQEELQQIETRLAEFFQLVGEAKKIIGGGR